MATQRRAETHVDNLMGALSGEGISLGGGMWAPVRFDVHYQDGRREAWLEIRVGSDAKPRVTQVRTAALDAGAALTVEDLRLPLRSILEDAWGEVVQPGQDEPRGTLTSQVREWTAAFAPTFGVGHAARKARADIRKRGYTVVTDELLRRVAKVYREAVKTGRPPIVAVTLNMAERPTRATAKRWVGEARSREFLGETSPRVAGERKRKGKR